MFSPYFVANNIVKRKYSIVFIWKSPTVTWIADQIRTIIQMKQYLITESHFKTIHLVVSKIGIAKYYHNNFIFETLLQQFDSATRDCNKLWLMTKLMKHIVVQHKVQIYSQRFFFCVILFVNINVWMLMKRWMHQLLIFLFGIWHSSIPTNRY